MDQQTYLLKMLKTAVITLLALIVAVACMPVAEQVDGADQSPVPSTTETSTVEPDEHNTDASNLENTWILINYGPEAEPITPLPNAQVTATFADGMVQGNASCNSYSAPYTLNGSMITIEQVVRTEMACIGDGIMQQEDAYLQALHEAQSFSIDGDTLTITYDGGILRFESAPPPPEASLEGTLWELHTFVEGDAATSLVDGTEITAQFANGQVSGTAGCNQYSGTYTLENTTIAIDLESFTMMACPQSVMQQEDTFVMALESSSQLGLEQDQLTLIHGGGELIFRASDVAE